MKKSLLLILVLIIVLFGGSCSKNEKNNIIDKKFEQEQLQEPIAERKIEVVNMESNSRPYAVVVNNFPSAVKVQTGLSDAYLIYEMPVEGGMSRSLALYKDKVTSKIGTVRSARHNFLDYVMENDAIFVHFGYSHYAQKEIPTLGINNINGLFDSPFWRENPEGLATEHTAYTSLEKCNEVAKNKGYRLTTENKGVLNYSLNEVDLSKIDDNIIANNVTVTYSNNYYEVNFKYDENSKNYKRYVNGIAHTDYFTKEHFSAKNIIVVKFNFVNASDNYYLDFKNVGTGNGYYITNGYAIPITWEKKDRTSKTLYKKLDGTEINVNDGTTYIMMQSANIETKIN